MARTKQSGLSASRPAGQLARVTPTDYEKLLRCFVISRKKYQSPPRSRNSVWKEIPEIFGERLRYMEEEDADDTKKNNFSFHFHDWR